MPPRMIDMQRGQAVKLYAPGGIIRAGLVAEYRFDEGGGQVLTDYSGNGHHGQLGATTSADTNDPTWTSKGLSFDGTDDFASLPTFLGGASAVTLVVVGVANAIGSDAQRPLSGHPSGASAGIGMQRGSSDGGLHLTWGNGASWSGTSALAITDDQPFCAHATHDGDTGTLYVGKTEKTSLAAALSMPVSPDWYVGRPPNDFGYWDGDIYYVLLYGRALTALEVGHNFDAVKLLLARRGVSL